MQLSNNIIALVLQAAQNAAPSGNSPGFCGAFFDGHFCRFSGFFPEHILRQLQESLSSQLTSYAFQSHSQFQPQLMA